MNGGDYLHPRVEINSLVKKQGKLTMDTVSDNLLGEEARRMERGESIHPEANVIENWHRNETRGRNKSCDPHQSRGRSKSR